jgi:hypothetical protein
MVDAKPPRYSLMVNGLDNAFPREFGCSCERCRRPERAANTSMSLLGTSADGDMTHFHALIDCGQGTSDSLAANPLLRGERARLDWLLFTHWHADHSAEIGRIGATWARTCARRGRPFERIPAWCRENAAAWLAYGQPLAWPFFAQPRVAPGFDDAGVVLAEVPVEQPGLRITPITLHHSSADIACDASRARRPSCAGFVVQTSTRKAVLFWDMDSTNTWITEPRTPAHAKALALARDADLLCVDCNTWRYSGSPERSASHASFHVQMEFARALTPRQTWLMHLSGHEDQPGDGYGWIDAEWRDHAKAAWAANSLPGEVDVPAIGSRWLF